MAKNVSFIDLARKINKKINNKNISLKGIVDKNIQVKDENNTTPNYDEN